MFGKSKSLRIIELETKVASLTSVLGVTENRKEELRRDLNAAERRVVNRDLAIHHLREELATMRKESNPLHEHNFSDLEARVLADMLARPSMYSDYGISKHRWSARSPSLQNLPRRPAPVLVNVSFEYRGKRSTFPLGNSTIKLAVVELAKEGITRVICHKPDESIVHYDYRTSEITSEIRKEWK